MRYTRHDENDRKNSEKVEGKKPIAPRVQESNFFVYVYEKCIKKSACLNILFRFGRRFKK